jgi:Bacterial SH3 domain
MQNRPLPAKLAVLVLLLSYLPAAGLAQDHNDAARNRPGDFVINRPAGLYARPSADARIIRELRPRTIVSVVEVLDQWYKIHSTRGHEDGYVRRSYADPYAGTAGQGRRFRVGIFKLTDPVNVRDAPSMDARQIASLRAGTELRIVDKDPSGLWYKVESETGRHPPGWIPTQAARRLGDVP